MDSYDVWVEEQYFKHIEEKEMTERVLVATYGSLRTGQANFVVNEMAGGKSIGEGWTVENYNLYRYNGAYFPSVSLTDTDNEQPVRVEVFETTEKGLTGPYDRLEGYPSFYNRTKVPVKLDDGEVVEAWIYHIDEPKVETVKHGDWVKYLADKED